MSIRQEAAMDQPTLERLERTPMSRADFDALPEGLRGEYVDGVAIVSPPARGGHNAVGLELAVTLRAALPGAFITYERGVTLPTGTLRIPDLAVQRVRDDEHWSPEVPVLVVEILSASTREEDLFRKASDYRRAGIAQYWVVDRVARTLTALVNAGEHWDIALALTEKRPTGSIAVADLGEVEPGPLSPAGLTRRSRSPAPARG
ncbi:Uma2 family endonuclease [Nocardioides sp. W3-2-3]|uniref:Uma2 family endonuclease n=1 Tax=Nocardioides convexus TaxID=2712224 RepID=UPI0024188863|nr:Uma2 family endonuclease [Nocardioides convexus]NHA00861.1 Uma2 family endonuclease [Nocardioides convexus]